MSATPLSAERGDERKTKLSSSLFSIAKCRDLGLDEQLSDRCVLLKAADEERKEEEEEE
eukprot:m.34638 g.34638  ORF g.34638 m.34638 type:complete len:59 (-) comp11048_c1_seq1:535-711(-)